MPWSVSRSVGPGIGPWVELRSPLPPTHTPLESSTLCQSGKGETVGLLRGTGYGRQCGASESGYSSGGESVSVSLSRCTTRGTHSMCAATLSTSTGRGARVDWLHLLAL